MNKLRALFSTTRRHSSLSSAKMAPRIAIIYYSMYGHIAKLALEEKAGIEAAGGTADLFQIRETLPSDVLSKMHAPPQDTAIPLIAPDAMKTYDGFLFGIPTRFGNYPAQWKTFIDQLGGLWMAGALHGKSFGLFVGSASMGGGQESTALAALSVWVHHGMAFVPLGTATSAHLQGALDEVRGGSAWGAGTFASGDGSRMPSERELELARIQGREFYGRLAKVSA